MRYRKLGSSELNCSVIGLGTWGMGGDWGGYDEEAFANTIHAAIDAGINLIDTAAGYGCGKSETLIGKSIKGMRDKVILCTKFGRYRVNGEMRRNITPASIRWQLEQSLTRLDVDTIDLYQMHWPDFDTGDPAAAFKEANKIREEGIARYIGVSNFAPEQIELAKQYCPIVSLQPPYSLLNRKIEKEVLPYCASHNVGTLTYGSIASGALTGKFKERPTFNSKDPRGGSWQDPNRAFYSYYTEEEWPRTTAMVDALRVVAEKNDVPVVFVAIAWALKQPGVTVTLCGAKSPEQVRMNAAAGDFVLSDEDNAFILEQHARIYGQ